MKLLIRYTDPLPDTISTILDSTFLFNAPSGVEFGNLFFTRAPIEDEKKTPTATEEAKSKLDFVFVLFRKNLSIKKIEDPAMIGLTKLAVTTFFVTEFS